MSLSRREILAALTLGTLAPGALAGTLTMELPAPPTAAQAFSGEQLLKWIKALTSLAREDLALRLPAEFTPQQEAAYRVSWHAEVSRVKAWFTAVALVDRGDERSCRFSFQPNNPITRALARDMLGAFEPLPPPGPDQRTSRDPQFDRSYFRIRLADGRNIHLSFEPLERGGKIHELTLTAAAPR